MRRVASSTLWTEALAMMARAERLHGEFFRPTSAGWAPPIDMLETDTELRVVVALPGVRPNDVEIAIGASVLTVVAMRSWPDIPSSARVHRLELPHGRFERRLPLPAGAYQLAGKSMVDGCLFLTLRKLV